MPIATSPTTVTAEWLRGNRYVPELVGWTDTYLTWVDDPEPAKQRIDGDPVSVACALGDIERSTDWIEFFTRELAEAHWRDVVDAWWPRLRPGISAAGTHGFLRTAHAVRAMNEHGSEHPLLLDEIAHGLGYWAARYQELPEEPMPSIDALRTAAVEHVIKFTDACLTEFTISGDDTFLRAASLAPARFGALHCKPS